MTPARLTRIGLVALVAAAALAVPRAASAAPTNGIYQGTIGDDPQENATAFVGTVSKRVFKRVRGKRVRVRVRVQEITAFQATVGMVCNERFGQSSSEVPYSFRHVPIVRKRGRYTFTLSQRTVKRLRTRRGGRTVVRRVTVRRVTLKGVIAGNVGGTLRVDELRRRGTVDGFGALSPAGPVRCSTDVLPFSLPLTPPDLLAPSNGELEDGSLPA
jgi:hypothetical protein